MTSSTAKYMHVETFINLQSLSIEINPTNEPSIKTNPNDSSK